MSLSSDLLEKGISLNNTNIGSHKTKCPRCSPTRKKKNDPCLWVNIKEHDLALWKCHNCQWTGSAGNVTKYAKIEKDAPPRQYAKPDRSAKQKVEESILPPKVMEFFSARGITPEVLRRNGIFWEDNAICFPYYIDGELTNVKYRTLDKKFRLVKDARLTFYGLDDVKDAETIIIVEGEMDKLALEVCGVKNVISVPNGAQREYKKENDSQLAYLVHAEAVLKKAKRIIIATDNDQPGIALRMEIARRCGLVKCWTVKWTGDMKDANDSLMRMGIDQTLLALEEAKPFPIKGLYEVSDFEDALRNFYDIGMRSGASTGFENLDEFFMVMPGEMTVVTGVPNSGKSEFIDAMCVNLAKDDDWHFGVFSPENGKEQHVVKLAEKILGITSSPKSPDRMTIDQLLEGAAWVGQHFHFIVSDDENEVEGDENSGLPTLKWVLDMASIAVMRFGIKGLIIDPWNELEHAWKSHQTESVYISMALAQIKRWARNHGVHVWIIAHPTKMQTDKDGNVQVPSLYNISGSANWVNKADNGIVVHREISNAEVATGMTDIHVRKVRQKHIGKVGMTTMKYDKKTGRYSPSMTQKQKKLMEEAEGSEYEPDDMYTYEH